MDKTLEEKIKLSEELVDKHLDEIAVSAAGIQAGTYAVSTAHNIVKDLSSYYQRKMAERQERLKQKEEEKKKLMAQKKQNKNMS